MLLEGRSPHNIAGVPASSKLVASCEPDKPTKVLALLRSVDDLGVVQLNARSALHNGTTKSSAAVRNTRLPRRRCCIRASRRHLACCSGALDH